MPDEFEPDVQDIARQLARADFSTESRIRYTLRQRLMQHNTPPRRFAPRLRLATVAATLVLVVVGLALTRPSTPEQATATEISLQPTAAAVEVQTDPQYKFYDIQSVQEYVDYDVYYPRSIPEDYEYILGWVVGESVKTIFQNKTVLESALIANNAYGKEIDYLYLVQVPDSGEPKAITHPFATGSIRYEFIQSEGEIGITSATLEDGRSALIAVWSEGGWHFQMWSYKLPASELEAIAQSVVPYNQIYPSENCPKFEGLREPSLTEWNKPIVSADYPVRSSDNLALEIDVPSGVAVSAVNAGIVVYVGDNKNGSGKQIVIAHDSYYSYYERLSVTSVTCGSPIGGKQPIGGIGDMGFRFAITDLEGNPIDPASLIDFEAKAAAPSSESTAEVSVSSEACVSTEQSATVYNLSNWITPVGNVSILRPFTLDHLGVAFRGIGGQSVYAASDGIVISIENKDDGQVITLSHPSVEYDNIQRPGYFSRYSPVTNVWLTCGDRVRRGQRIAEFENESLYFELLDPAMHPLDPGLLVDFKVDNPFLHERPSLVFEADAPGTCPVALIPGLLGIEWRSPLKQFRVGKAFSDDHPAILLEAAEGEPVYPATEGIVVFAGQRNSETGQTVILAHGNGYSLYRHLSEISVECGAQVNSEQQIGKVGATGNASGTFLRFEAIDLEGRRFDPFILLKPRSITAP